MNLKVDLTGRKFGRLTVISFAGQARNYKSKWFCICECDGAKIVAGHNLKSGNTSSCGCVFGVKISHPPTQDQIKALFDYDPESGILTWLRGGNGVSVGNVAGHDARGYVELSLGGKKYPAHNIIWLWMKGEFPERELDHENLIRSDNRFSNLRPATRPQNSGNVGMRSHNTSGFKGVTWNQSSRSWIAQMGQLGKRIYLGSFADKEDAARAYDRAAVEYFGDFARINFPLESVP